jgi:hypothetical protein
MWSKVIEKNMKASGLKKERLERFNPLKTSSLSFLMIIGIYVVSNLQLVGNFEISFAI